MAQFHVIAGASEVPVYPQVRRIGVSDIVAALREGLDDFWDKPSHYVFLCLIYPIVGVVLMRWSSGANTLPLIFPLMSGFALIGPLAALGLYEISRRRELNLDTSWRHAFEVRHSPAIPSIIAVGVMLFAIFIAWLLTAQSLYTSLFGSEAPVSMRAFLDQVFNTPEGQRMILLGNAIGFVFAVVVLCTSVVTFPLLLDRDVGAFAAVLTSIKAVAVNPVTMALWGLIVAALLVVGFLTLFVGLAIIIPVLGHATWHLYRKVVEPQPILAEAKKRPVRR
ncbi:DUF2189 domain-containing protein [Phyllobacterium sp. 22229]|uniref:DUF2189 domain-containing protein n=1 Tax=Phyllobacterium myrsinacearum TaxID=28101 RepID=A0A2S9JH42_9HYPH|nr:DUF2189 domain-containing protein [Phyllobacterium myrsinacearum]PRD52300.1 hypothetical protein C5750_15510 [Phyllobacterium myrsinacearum]PWV92342.1 putative membrane protein [Phyllobacterium myrsinacearum]RZV04849.1 putative membrane protein [Phyllobacterium myrsinacearum]